MPSIISGTPARSDADSPARAAANPAASLSQNASLAPTGSRWARWRKFLSYYRPHIGLLIADLACAALVSPGDEILMPDPCYPCNRHFVTAFEGVPVMVPTGPAERFQLSEAALARHWGPRTRGVLLASPSNPTVSA